MERIRELRQSLKMNQYEFAEHCSVSRASIARYEAGEKISRENAIKIAAACNVSVDYLLGSDNGSESVTDDDIRFALSGGEEPITQAQLEEVKQFVRFIRERDKNDGNK